MMSLDTFLVKLEDYNPNEPFSQLLSPKEMETALLGKIMSLGLFGIGLKVEGKNKQAMTLEESEILQRNIVSLSEELLNEFLENSQNVLKIGELKNKINNLFQRGNLIALEDAINKGNISKKSEIIKEINRLNRTITSIVSAYNTHNHENILLDSSETIILADSPGSIAKRHQIAIQNTRDFQDIQRIKLYQNTITQFSLTETCKPIISLLVLENKMDLEKELKKFDSGKFIVLINEMKKNEAYHQKIIDMISLVDYEVLENVLLSMDNNWIKEINLLLRKLPNQHLKEAVKIIRQRAADKNNYIKNKIDAIAAKLRIMSVAGELKIEDIDEIDLLSSHVTLSSDAVQNLMALLFGVIKESETEQVLKEIIDQYHHFSLRLSIGEDVYSSSKNSDEIKELMRLGDFVTVQHKDRQTLAIMERIQEHLATELSRESKRPLVEGSAYGIIYRNLVFDNDLELSSPAIEIFGAWSIINRKDYEECGLLDKGEKPTFNQIELYKHIGEKLRKQNINEIRDWFRIKVFNKEMLKKRVKS